MVQGNFCRPYMRQLYDLLPSLTAAEGWNTLAFTLLNTLRDFEVNKVDQIFAKRQCVSMKEVKTKCCNPMPTDNHTPHSTPPSCRVLGGGWNLRQGEEQKLGASKLSSLRPYENLLYCLFVILHFSTGFSYYLRYSILFWYF